MLPKGSGKVPEGSGAVSENASKKNSLQPVVYHGEPVVYFLPPYQLNTLNIIVQLFASLILYAKNIIELLLPMPKTTFKIILTLFNMQNNMERHCNAGP